MFLGFNSAGEAVVLKDCQIVVEDLFQKKEEHPIDDHHGDEDGFEQELWNEEVEALSKEYRTS